MAAAPTLPRAGGTSGDDYQDPAFTRGVFREPDPWLDTQAPATEHLGEIRLPTLVITGDHDIPDHHRQARLLADGIPDARLVVIPGASHMVYMEQPDRFNDAVLEFLLQQVRTGRGGESG